MVSNITWLGHINNKLFKKCRMADQIEKKILKKDFTKTTYTKKLKSKITKSDNHIIKKRIPFLNSKKKNDIYVNNKTDFKVYLKLCEKHLNSDVKEVIIHGLGAAVNRACNLALHLQKIHHGTLELDIKTSSVNLIDDLEPKFDNADYEVSERQNSAIHIRVFQTALIGLLRFEN